MPLVQLVKGLQLRNGIIIPEFGKFLNPKNLHKNNYSLK